MGALVPSVAVPLPDVRRLFDPGRLVAWSLPLALATWLALAPVAFYLAVGGERDG